MYSFVWFFSIYRHLFCKVNMEKSLNCKIRTEKILMRLVQLCIRVPHIECCSRIVKITPNSHDKLQKSNLKFQTKLLSAIETVLYL